MKIDFRMAVFCTPRIRIIEFSHSIVFKTSISRFLHKILRNLNRLITTLINTSFDIEFANLNLNSNLFSIMLMGGEKNYTQLMLFLSYYLLVGNSHQYIMTCVTSWITYKDACICMEVWWSLILISDGWVIIRFFQNILTWCSIFSHLW